MFTSDSEVQRTVLGPMLASALWGWSEYVFKPALQLRSMGLYSPNRLGAVPEPVKFRGGGPVLSKKNKQPVLLEHEPGHYDSVVEFDHCAGDYETAVKPFSQPIFEETLAHMLPYLTPDSRILDPSAGPGIEAIDLARIVPDGEVVAADLSRGMVEEAYFNAQRKGITNMAFFQADVSNPPEVFEGYFDAIYCSLAFHHYPDGLGAVKAFRRVLAPNGKAFIADPGPAWFNQMSREFAKLTDPGFVQHRTGVEFSDAIQTGRLLRCVLGRSTSWYRHHSRFRMS